MNLLKIWNAWKSTSLGRWWVSRLLGWVAPYTGSVGAVIEVLEPGYSRVRLKDRRRVRNHLNSIHAVALMNLGEMTTGICLMASLPEGARLIIKDFRIEFLKKARGQLKSEARTEISSDMSKRDVPVTAEIRNQEGEVVCRATTTWRVGPPA